MVAAPYRRIAAASAILFLILTVAQLKYGATGSLQTYLDQISSINSVSKPDPEAETHSVDVIQQGESSTSIGATVTSPSTTTTSGVDAIATPFAKGDRFAFATFMNRNVKNPPTDDDDGYFVMARMMAFQLLHNPETKTKKGYPFIVFVSEGVKPSKIERLRKDGATIIPVEQVKSDWLKTKNSQWWDQLTKLRLFEQTDYDRIAYFDTDNVIRKNIDDIFHDPAANISFNLNVPTERKEDEGEQPAQYVFAAVSGAGRLNHTLPPPPGKKNLNAGCFVLMPSKDVFNHYIKVLSIEGRFPKKYMEQNLLSYVHRLDGNMPWKVLDYTWNTNYVTWNDVVHDIATLHSKYWDTDYDLKLKEYVMELKGKMYGYWLAKEGVD